MAHGRSPRHVRKRAPAESPKGLHDYAEALKRDPVNQPEGKVWIDTENLHTKFLLVNKIFFI